MDIPQDESVTIKPRTGEGAYGPTFGSGVTSTALVQEVSSRVLNTDGEQVVADFLAFLPPGTGAKVGDRCDYDGRSFEILTVDRLRVEGVANHVEIVAKSRTFDDGGVTPPAPTTVEFQIVWGQAENQPFILADELLDFVVQDHSSNSYPEIEFLVNGSWTGADGEIWNGLLFLAVSSENLYQASYRVLTQPSLINTLLDVPKSGTVEDI